MKSYFFDEHIESIFNFVSPKDKITRDWILRELQEREDVFINLFEKYPHTPPSFILFVFFIYGINPTTKKQVGLFQKRFNKLGNRERWNDVDLAFDVNIYIQMQALESKNPTAQERRVSIELINIERKRKMSLGLPLKGTNNKILDSIIQEIIPSRNKWSVSQILIRQKKFDLN